MFDVFYTGPKPNLFAFERPADSVEHARAQSRTTSCWFIDGNNNYSDFKFDWRPRPDQADYVHCWPSQWQRSGGTFLIPKHTAELQWHWHDVPVAQRQQSAPIVYLDFLNPESEQGYKQLTNNWTAVKSTRYVDNHLTVLKRIATTATADYVWIVSSICDYTAFDFTWHPAQWQETMLHVFPSGHQRRGDTFYMNVAEFRRQAESLELLDWYTVINYCNDQTVSRHPVETLFYDSDNLIEEVKQHKFLTPYAVFSNTENLPNLDTDVCLWRERDRAVLSYNAANSVALITRDVKTHLTTQLYDYPYINKSQVVASKASDVIFISNGEPMAEENWQNLLRICPRAKRSDGVTGRELAYKTAAQLSDTPWFYAVFAKTEVLDSFDFSFVPDYFQEPKHYIFHSRNPLNGLEYGAMNINLYNRQLVLDTKPGLDFTLSAAHEVVPICASISRFNTDPWITWRSAFREVLKLRLEVDQGAGVEIQHRLKVWCSRASGENAEYCLQGARDAVEYYEQVGGDYQALKLSFDWAWLEEFYYNKYGVRIWLEVA